jgi:hypothetical protein
MSSEDCFNGPILERNTACYINIKCFQYHWSLIMISSLRLENTDIWQYIQENEQSLTMQHRISTATSTTHIGTTSRHDQYSHTSTNRYGFNDTPSFVPI